MVFSIQSPNRYPTTPIGKLQRTNEKQHANSTRVQFSGAGDAISAFIGLIDRSRAAELVASDGLGMLVPRTGVAAAFRGADDARETLIREGAGLVCVALLAGLTNQAMIHLLGNRVGLYNPHGIPGKAWISARNLRVFSELYNQSLAAKTSLPAARQHFVQTVLDGLESTDRALSITGRLSTLQELSRAKAEQPVLKQALKKMVDWVDRSTNRQLKDSKALSGMLQSGRGNELHSLLLNAGWGQLSKQGKTELAEWFQQKSPNSAGLKGTEALDRQAWKHVLQFRSGASPDQVRHDFLKERLRLSLEALKTTDAEFLKRVDQIALDQGLTSLVNLKQGGKNLSAAQSRQTLLKELKHFLEQYVDRAVYQATHNQPGLKAPLSSAWESQRERVRQTLFSKGPKGLGSLFPRSGQGLVTATLKSKAAYTWLPIGVAIVANGVSTFMNNYITQVKYGGKVFFPGEESALPSASSFVGGVRPPLQTGYGYNQTGRWA